MITFEFLFIYALRNNDITSVCGKTFQLESEILVMFVCQSQLQTSVSICCVHATN